jgi:hypothetical protein
MADYVYIIMLLKTRIFDVVFTIIWPPKCFWYYKNHVIFKCIFDKCLEIIATLNDFTI